MKESQKVKAIYAFSGDPITNGHVDVIRRAYKYFPNLVVGIGVNPSKKYTFSLEERIEMAKHCVRDLPGVEVVSYEGLLVDYAYEHNIEVIIRGIRNSQDFEYEYNFYLSSKAQGIPCETFPIFTNPELSHISSSVVKAYAKEQGKIDSFVDLYVKKKIEERLLGQYIVAVTGSIGCGKSYVSNKFVELGKTSNIPVHDIDLDKISHEILSTLDSEQYVKIRSDIARFFKDNYDEEVQNPDGSIDRKAVGTIVFADSKAKKFLDDVMRPAIEARMRKEMYGKKGLILINAALVVENDLLHYSNNNVIVITADKKIQEKRLKARNYSDEQIKHRIKSQLTSQKKLDKAHKKINECKQGMAWILDTSAENDENIIKLFNHIVGLFKIPSDAE